MSDTIHFHEISRIYPICNEKLDLKGEEKNMLIGFDIGYVNFGYAKISYYGKVPPKIAEMKQEKRLNYIELGSLSIFADKKKNDIPYISNRIKAFLEYVFENCSSHNCVMVTVEEQASLYGQNRTVQFSLVSLIHALRSTYWLNCKIINATRVSALYGTSL